MTIDPQLDRSDDTAAAHRVDGCASEEITILCRTQEPDRHLIRNRHRFDAYHTERSEPQRCIGEQKHGRATDIPAGPKLGLIEGPPCGGTALFNGVTTHARRGSSREHLDEARVDLFGRRDGGVCSHEVQRSQPMTDDRVASCIRRIRSPVEPDAMMPSRTL